MTSHGSNRSSGTTVTVAAAIIRRGRSILIARRALGIDHGGMWELPGGKVEPGESPDAALEREIREELGARISVGRSSGESVHDYDGKTVILLCFECTLIDDSVEPRLGEHSELRWVQPEELRAFRFTEADIPIIESLADV